MKIIVLGMGLMGPTVAKDCVADPLVELVIGCDIDEVQLKKAASRVKSKKFITKKINIIDHNELV